MFTSWLDVKINCFILNIDDIKPPQFIFFITLIFYKILFKLRNMS